MSLRRVLALTLLTSALTAAPAVAAPVLEGRAVLGARTFADGPASGAAITGNTNGVPVPFPSQPVQGFSSVNRAAGGGYWVMPDNGFGAEANSRDYLLRIYRLFPDFETARGGSGTIAVGRFLQLRDPDGLVGFPIERADRLLTGGDFDPESFRIARNGDLWIGDEFGPYLLHTDATGKLLDEPIRLPGVRSPDSPPVGVDSPDATLGRSRGFEGMAISPDRRTLYPMLEGELRGDPADIRRIYEFDIRDAEYTGRVWRYRTSGADDRFISELVALDRNRFLVVERDNAQGEAAAFKKVFLVDLRRRDAGGVLRKREVLDLLAIRDPRRISLPARPGDIGLGAAFSFPFQTIEALQPLARGRVLVLNDNNFPFSTGRNPGLPDHNEAIVVRVPGLR